MSRDTTAAERLVFSAISAENRPSYRDAQELPALDLIGAAIARASRIAAAQDRARRPGLALANTQASGLIKASSNELDALFADLNAEEGRILAVDGLQQGFLWRFHAAPASAGPCIAPTADGARA